MLELFERTLASGGDLEWARQTLLNQTNIDRLNRNAEIEHDFRIATLIKECLLMEPKGTAGYAVSKGIMNRLKEKFHDPVTDSVIRKMNRQMKREERKEQLTDDGNRKEERNSSDSAGTETTVVN